MVGRMRPTEVDLCLSSGGTNLPFHIGFIEGLEISNIRIKRISGVSAGAIVAAAYAFGKTVEEMTKLAKRLLGPSMLDPNWLPFLFGNNGLNAGHKLHQVAKWHMKGPMGSAMIPWGAVAVDLETRQPVIFRSDQTPGIPAADVVRASAGIPFFFNAIQIGNEPGLYVDGAVSISLGMGMWDDEPDRYTLGARFKSTPKRQEVKNMRDFTVAVLDTLVANADQAYISKKVYQNVVDIQTGRSGMDFDLTEKEIDGMIAAGRHRALKWAGNL